MLRIYNARFPSIVDPVTGATVAVFADSAAGWSLAVSLATELVKAL